MRVIVVSDTHIPERAPALPPALVKGLAEADMILHLGDFTAPEVLEELRAIAETHAVYGNCDSYEVTSRLPAKQVIEVNGKRIGMTHGSGGPHGLLERVKRQFAGDPVDAVLFGHSHVPLIERSGGVLYANPGSPTDRYTSGKPTYLRLEVGGRIGAELVELAV